MTARMTQATVTIAITVKGTKRGKKGGGREELRRKRRRWGATSRSAGNNKYIGSQTKTIVAVVAVVESFLLSCVAPSLSVPFDCGMFSLVGMSFKYLCFLYTGRVSLPSMIK